MALSAEQRAILELLNDRGLSHAEIDDLLGGEPGEARRRERAALEAISEEEAAELNVTPAPAVGGTRRKWARIGVGVLAAVAVGLGAGALVKGGSDEPSETTASATTDEAPETVRVPLEATGEGDGARGEAAIGLDEQFEPFLDLDLEGLPPAPEGSIYVPWVELGGNRGVPVPSPIAVEDGAFSGRLEIAPQLISVFDVGRELQILALGRAELAELSRQVRGGRGAAAALQSPGGAVLSGPVPTQ